MRSGPKSTLSFSPTRLIPSPNINLFYSLIYKIKNRAQINWHIHTSCARYSPHWMACVHARVHLCMRVRACVPYSISSTDPFVSPGWPAVMYTGTAENTPGILIEEVLASAVHPCVSVSVRVCVRVRVSVSVPVCAYTCIYMYIYAWVDSVVTNVRVRCDTVWWNLRCAFECNQKKELCVHVCVCVCVCEYGLISMHAWAWDGALRLINIDSELSPLAGSQVGSVLQIRHTAKKTQTPTHSPLRLIFL